MFLIIAIAVLFLVVAFLTWQLTKFAKENQEISIMLQEQAQQIHAQEEHLKQTLQIMQDLAKKMHVQQEVLDNTTQRMAQVEIQNAELIRLLQQNFSSE